MRGSSEPEQPGTGSSSLTDACSVYPPTPRAKSRHSTDQNVSRGRADLPVRIRLTSMAERSGQKSASFPSRHEEIEYVQDLLEDSDGSITIELVSPRRAKKQYKRVPLTRDGTS
jgi:hypothetical protein